MAQSAADRHQARVAVFLDRDGVINRRAPEGGYIRRWAEFEFLPGALDALSAMQDAGAALFVATNQRGVARGLVEPRKLTQIHLRMRAAAAAAGVRFAGIFVCPHEVGMCDCRKPDVGLFRQAQQAQPWVSFAEAHLVGDSISDLQAGHRLGMRLWLVGAQHRAVARRARQAHIPLAGTAPSLAQLVAAGALLASIRAR
jgi:D-glycero-D-manno-heptose 1,7-bisphosphate phosphatase